MKWCFCAYFLALAAVLVSAQHGLEVDAYDYDNEYDYDQLKEEGDRIEAELDALDAERDLKVKEEITKFREENLQNVEPIDAHVDGIEDYQFEDNRDKPKDNPDGRKLVPADSDGSFEADDAAVASEDLEDSADIDDEKKKQEDQADYALLWGDDSVAPLPVPDVAPEDKDIIEETQKILDNDADDFDEEIKKAIANVQNFSENKPDSEIIDETKKILEETDDSFNNREEINEEEKVIDESLEKFEEIDDTFSNEEEQLNNEELDEFESKPVIIDEIPIEKALDGGLKAAVESDKEDEENNEKENDNEPIEHEVIVEGDTVEKVYADLNADLDKLLDTLDKLSGDSLENDEKIEEVFDKIDDKLFKEDVNNVEGSDELVADIKDDNYADVDFDKILQDIIEENDMKVDDSANMDLNVLLNDELNEPNPDDAFERDVEPLPKIDDEPILFLDAFVDDKKNAESIESEDNKSPEINASVEAKNPVDNSNAAIAKEDPVPETNKFETVDIDKLNSQELEGLVKQFAKTHSEVFDVNSDTFNENIAPIHMTLNVDEPTVVMSPNYPSPYPTNNIIDWVFAGEGMGIEMNITDFLVNGALGDYLLVKPGGIDEIGHDGILFTYRLNSEKRFRFADVDRLFVRFEAKPGMMFMRGFQFSVKMMGPLPEEPEPIPEAEPVLEPPHSRHTLYLATAVPQFTDLNETFRVLLADMAEQYIVDNNIEPGLNTTSEVTQITSISTCPVTWPNYELCTAVTFGVSLSYEEEGEQKLDEEDLRSMWSYYSTSDPYALRLRQMGVAEFNPPSSSVLTAWLVIASGVLISMVMLAFVLWRFSCFEDYTRMKNYGDTDSLHNEKRGLDLYPTPHQTLPPLFSENEYKWTENDDTTRVDMGGFANRSYARDMYDLESDEEVVVPKRDRTGVIDNYDGSNA